MEVSFARRRSLSLFPSLSLFQSFIKTYIKRSNTDDSNPRGRGRSSTSHSGGGLKIPIAFLDDLEDLDLEEDEDAAKNSSNRNPRDRVGTGMVPTPKVFGIREAKYNRNSNRIQKDRKVTASAFRSTSA